MKRLIANSTSLSRRNFITGAGGVGLAGLLGAANWPARADGFIELPFANGRRELVTNFPQKGAMILQRTRPPLLETPFEVFDQGVFTPNARFYVRWHLADIPTSIDPAKVPLKVRGHVGRPLSLTMHDLLHDFPPFEIAAVNQCSGNSRGFFSPRVTGGQWDNGAMGNALWRGVRLKDVLDRAGVSAGAVEVRFRGLDRGVVPIHLIQDNALQMEGCRCIGSGRQDVGQQSFRLAETPAVRELAGDPEQFLYRHGNPRRPW